MLRILLSVFIVVFTLKGHTYQSTDQTAVMMTLPPNWTTSEVNSRSPQIIKHLEYRNVSLTSPSFEILNQMTILKPSKQAGDQVVNEIFRGLTETIKKECQVSELRQISSNSSRFKEWASDFQCGQTKSSILIVDADPANIYLFTYTVNTSTPNMMKKLQEMVKICYKKGEKDSDCYSISSH